MNGEAFHTYVLHELVPTLKPRDIVIADNLDSHRTKVARAAVRAVGARLVLLPEYSPDLNPIEQVFTKLGHLLRRAGARSRDAVADRVATLLQTPHECQNYFRNSEYGPLVISSSLTFQCRFLLIPSRSIRGYQRQHRQSDGKMPDA